MMTRHYLLAALPVTLAATACATTATPPPIADGTDPDARCTEQGTSEFIGKTASQAVGEEIQRRTGARIFQWVGPDQAVTMDYRLDRVRVSYDSGMKITRVSCG